MVIDAGSSLRLSDDALCEVLQYTSTLDLIACSAVCRQWRNITTSTSSLWRKKEIQLKGTLKQIDSQWRTIWQHLDDGQQYTISIQHSDRNECTTAAEIDRYWTTASLLSTFPFELATSIRYSGVSNYIDQYFWKAIERCTVLDTLQYRSRQSRFEYSPAPAFWSEDSPITKCRLSHLELDSDYSQHFSILPAKYLDTLILKMVVQVDDLEWYLGEVADSLETLQIGAVEHRFNDDQYRLSIEERLWIDENASEASYDCNEHREINLAKLKSFRAINDDPHRTRRVDESEKSMDGMTRVTFNIIAPHVEELTYHHYLGWDKTLFDSCKGNLRVLYLEVNDHNLTDVYEAMDEILNCEELTIKMAVSGSRLWPNLWRGPRPISGMDASRIVSLPKLHTLSILDDNMIEGDELIRFVKAKRDLKGSQALMKLTLKDCFRVSDEAIALLQDLVPRCSYALEG